MKKFFYRMARSGAAVLLSAALFIGAGDLPVREGAVVFAEEGDTVASGTFGMGGDNLTWVLDGSGTLTISGTGDMGESIGGGAPWYRYGESIFNVKIEDGVTDIGSGAFMEVYDVDDNFIYSYPYLTSIEIPDSVTSIGWNAFTFCTGLTSIDIPDSVTSIGMGAFEGCTSLRNIKIPDGVTLIDDNVFGGCDSLESIEIPDSVTSIGIGAFHLCDNLKSITIPDSVTSVGEYAFSGCFSLESIIIPDGVTSIGEAAFECCDSLTSIIIPASVTLIGEDAFDGCSRLETVYVPEGLDVSKTSIPEGASVIKYIDIGDGRFKYIGACGDNLTWTLIDGTLTISGTGEMYDYDYDHGPWWYCRDIEIVNAVIEDGVTTIGERAFFDFTKLASITIPNSVKSIGDCAFGCCTNLSSISIPYGVESIGKYAFQYCEKLTSVTISDSVTSIDECAFEYCTSLTDVTIPAGVKEINSWIFSGCTGLKSITLSYGVETIKSFAFADCTGLENITIPNSVTFIDGCAFTHCTGLESITIPDSITSISGSTFEYCSGLKSITIPDSVTEIGYWAFRDCTSLESIDIPDSVTSIGDHVFYGCSSLTSITIPNSVTQIGDEAFQNCTNLTSITIPASVTSIGNNIFDNCSSLITVYIPEGLSTEPIPSTSAVIRYNVDENDDVTITEITTVNESDTVPIPETLSGYEVVAVDKDYWGRVGEHKDRCGSTSCTAKEPTCTEAGNKEYWTCNLCGALFLDSDGTDATTLDEVTTAALGHKLTEVSEAAATCTEAGNTAYWTCSVCGKLFTDSNGTIETTLGEMTAAATGHTLTAVLAKAATCTETGNTAYYKCDVCGKLFTDSNGTIETTESAVIVPATGHTLTAVPAKAATCTEAGNNTEYYKCDVCGALFLDSDGTNATTLDEVTAAATGHTLTAVLAKAATCTETGNTAYYKCNVCGALFLDSDGTIETTLDKVTIAATGHDYNSEVTTEPTVDSEGIRTYTCANCGDSYTEIISKLPAPEHQHEYTSEVTKAATCTESGVLTYTCVCGDSYTETIAATGHDYSSEVTTEPTTSAEGVRTYTCANCGDSYTESIPKLSKPTVVPSRPTHRTDTSDSTGDSASVTPDEPKADEADKPYIKNDSGKDGWEAIRTEVDASGGGEIIIEMNGTTEVPGDILNSIKGRDITLTFDMGDGVSWSVNGTDITAAVGTIDFGVTVGSSGIPVDVVNNVTGESYSLQLSLSYDGEFGFKAVLSIDLGTASAGYYASLYYYNAQSGEPEFISESRIKADGVADLEFTHASDYLVVVNEKSRFDKGDTAESTDSTDSSEPTGGDSGDNGESSNSVDSAESSPSGGDSSTSSGESVESDPTEENPYTGTGKPIIVVIAALGITAAIIASKKKRGGI